MSNKPEIILFHESLYQSFITDLMTFVFVSISFWFNHVFCNDSAMFNFFLFIVLVTLVFSFMPSRGRKFYSKQELINYLQ